MSRFSRIGDRYAWLIVFMAVLSAALLIPKRPAIQGDGVFYYAYLPAICLHHNLDFRNEYQQYQQAWLKSYWVDPNTPGRLRNWFPIGPAILWSPFFLLGHGVAKLAGNVGTPPGYSIYHLAFVFVGTFVYALAGLLILYRMLKNYFSQSVAFLSVTGIWLATSLLYYSTIEASYSHALDFFMACVVLEAWFHWRKEPERIGRSMWLGALMALAALVRWQSIGFLLLLAGDLVLAAYAERGAWSAKPFKVAASRIFLITIVAVGLFFAIQNPIWKAVNGQSLVSFGLHGDWKNPFFSDVLFSARNGLFTWTPIAWFCVVGLIVFGRKEPWVANVFFLFLAFQVYISTVHGVWYGGDSYGARRLSSSLPMLAFGLAALLEFAFRKGLVKLTLTALAAVILWNLGLMTDWCTNAQPHDRVISFMGVLQRRYRSIGDPLSFPANWIFSLRYHVPPARYDAVVGNYFFEFGTLGAGIDFGNPVYRSLLVDGWSGYESGSDALWAEGTRSRILLPLYTVGHYKLIFQVYPYSDPGLAPDQTMELEVNGTPVGKRTLAKNSGWTQVEFDIPRGVLKRGVNELEFDYAYAVSPLELGHGPDSRKLSVRFRQLAIARVINLGNPRYRPFLIEGWGPYETGSSAVWAKGAQSRILLPLSALKDYKLIFEIYPFPSPDSTRKESIQLSVNGAPVGQQTLSANGGWTTIEFDVPPRVQVPPVNELQFRYGYASPPPRGRRRPNPKELSIRFRRLEIVPEFPPLNN